MFTGTGWTRIEIQWSGNVENILGYAAVELPTSSVGWIESIHPDDRAKGEARV